MISIKLSRNKIWRKKYENFKIFHLLFEAHESKRYTAQSSMTYSSMNTHIKFMIIIKID